MISNCGHDENYRYSGGAAGDQNNEWEIKPFYQYPWDCVIRHPDAAVREQHASMAEAAARNDNIGYDQNERDSFGVQLKAVGDDPAKIRVKCETDCSKGIIDITKGIGRKLKRKELENITATYTGNMRQAYRNAGYQILTDSKYLTSDAYLLRGDILLNDTHHTATNLTNGSKSGVQAVQQTTQTTQQVANKTYKVGDVVEFTGTKHYASADDAASKACKPGKAKVTSVYDGKHPYHLVAEQGSGSTVYGWVDEVDCKKIGAKTYKVGDVVEFTGTKHYASADDNVSKACRPGKAKVTSVYDGKHPYHLVAEPGSGSTVYGWVDAADIK